MVLVGVDVGGLIVCMKVCVDNDSVYVLGNSIMGKVVL